jgi:hypothetical protein
MRQHVESRTWEERRDGITRTPSGTPRSCQAQGASLAEIGFLPKWPGGVVGRMTVAILLHTMESLSTPAAARWARVRWSPHPCYVSADLPSGACDDRLPTLDPAGDAPAEPSSAHKVNRHPLRHDLQAASPRISEGVTTKQTRLFL